MDWKQLRLLLKWLSLTQSSLCPVVLANLGNQTVLCLFTMSRLNYNHFQTGVITTESWSKSVRGTRCPRTTSGTHTYCSFHQNGHSKSRFRIFKVVLNSTCTYYLLLDMAFYFYKSYSFPLQLILLPRLSTDSAFFEWHSWYWPRSYTVRPVHPNFYFYKTFSFTAQLVLLPRLPDTKVTPQMITMIAGWIVVVYSGVFYPRARNISLAASGKEIRDVTIVHHQFWTLQTFLLLSLWD